MKTFTRDLNFVNFNGEEMQWIKFNNVTVYEAWRKLIASGVPPITLQKCKKANLLDYKIYGNSIQKGTNLFDGTYKNGYISSNKVVAFSETVATHYLVVMPCDPNTTYIVEKEYATERFTVGFTDEYPYTDCPIIGTLANNSAKKITATSGENSQYLIAFVYNKTVDTLPLPNIEVYKTQSPDNPIEVQSVGEKTNNLFDSSYLQNVPGWTFSNGWYTGDASSLLNYSTDNLVPIKFKENTQYTFSWTVNTMARSLRFVVYYTDGTYSFIAKANTTGVELNLSETSTAGKTIDHIIFDYSQNGYCSIKNVKIEEGTTATEYEPYCYKISVKVRGKNLFDYSSTEPDGSYLNGNGTISIGGSSNLRITDYIPIPDNTTYLTVSFSNGSMQSPGICLYDKDKNYITGSSFANKHITTIAVPSNVKYVRHSYRIINTNIQLECGSIATEYEPYVEPITTNIYLNEPLRKIGDYADYIDFENQKVVRNIVKINLFDLLWRTTSTSSLNGQFWTKPDSDIVYADGSGVVSNFLCTNYIVAKYSEYKIGDNIIYSSNNTKLIYVKDTDYTDLETFKSEVKGVLLAQLATPTEEIIELPTIPTHKGTTIIEVDTNILPSNMEVEYMGKE